MKVTGADAIAKKLQKMADTVDRKQMMRIIGVRAVDLVSKRALSGKDMNNKRFKGYSEGYKKQRAKKGAGLKVDLMLSGNMYAAMTYKTHKHGVTLFFRGGEENLKAHGHHHGRKGKESVSSHKRLITQAFGKPIAPRTALIGSFSRQMDTPSRKFFGLTKGERKKIMRIVSDSLTVETDGKAGLRNATFNKLKR